MPALLAACIVLLAAVLRRGSLRDVQDMPAADGLLLGDGVGIAALPAED